MSMLRIFFIYESMRLDEYPPSLSILARRRAKFARWKMRTPSLLHRVSSTIVRQEQPQLMDPYSIQPLISKTQQHIQSHPLSSKKKRLCQKCGHFLLAFKQSFHKNLALNGKGACETPADKVNPDSSPQGCLDYWGNKVKHWHISCTCDECQSFLNYIWLRFFYSPIKIGDWCKEPVTSPIKFYDRRACAASFIHCESVARPSQPPVSLLPLSARLSFLFACFFLHSLFSPWPPSRPPSARPDQPTLRRTFFVFLLRFLFLY